MDEYQMENRVNICTAVNGVEMEEREREREGEKGRGAMTLPSSCTRL